LLEESNEYQRLKSHKVRRWFRKALTVTLHVAIRVGVAGILNASNSLISVVLPSS
jgi:hypothetical protein